MSIAVERVGDKIRINRRVGETMRRDGQFVFLVEVDDPGREDCKWGFLLHFVEAAPGKRYKQVLVEVAEWTRHFALKNLTEQGVVRVRSIGADSVITEERGEEGTNPPEQKIKGLLQAG